MAIRREMPISEVSSLPQAKNPGRGRGGPKKLVLYRNGVLIEKNFRDYSTKSGKRLKKMLESNEIYSDLIGGNGDYIDVEIVEKDEEYPNPKRPGRVIKREEPRVNVPKDISLDDKGVLFKVLYRGRRVSVQMRADRKLKDLRCFLESLSGASGGRAVFLSGLERIDENVFVENVKSSVITLMFE